MEEALLAWQAGDSMEKEERTRKGHEPLARVPMSIGWRVLRQPKIPDAHDSNGHQQNRHHQAPQAQAVPARLLLRGAA